MDRSAKQDVLIVGAGPTGLSLALTLRKLGVRPRIIDRAAQPSAVSKALAVWSGSLEALHGMGVVDELLAAGTRLNFLSVGHGNRELARLAVGDGIDSPYPFPLLLAQSQTERILSARLAALGTGVERGVELVGLVQEDDGARAELRRHGQEGTETVRARYVIGCDGARSFVRHALGIPFEGYTEPQMFLLGDVHIDGGALDHQGIYLRWSTGGMVALFPFGTATWRVFTVRKGSTSDAPPTLDELQGHVDRVGLRGLRLRDPSWLSAFRINERLARHYRAGACFLAGDAAHIHSPAGGQGMNTGIQDAVNLGWKLAHALQGRGDAELLLDSYEAERRPIAREVIRASAQKLHVAMAAKPLALLAKDVAVGIFANTTLVQRKLQVELSETEIVYHDGPLVRLGTPPRRPRRTEVGARARDAVVMDRDTGLTRPLWSHLSELHHTLLVFDGDGRSPDIGDLGFGTGDRLQILHLDDRADPGGKARDRYRLRQSGWVLIRPDQVVAARDTGADLSRLRDYLERVLRRRPSAATGMGASRVAAHADAG